MSSTKRGKISARGRAAAVTALSTIAADETKPAHSRGPCRRRDCRRC